MSARFERWKPLGEALAAFIGCAIVMGGSFVLLFALHVSWATNAAWALQGAALITAYGVLRRNGPSIDYVPVAGSRSVLAISVIAGVLIGAVLAEIWPSLAGFSYENARSDWQQQAIEWWPLAAWVLVLYPLGAFGEEAFFRGALLPRARAVIGPRAGVALTTVAFALLHPSASGIVVAVFIGLLTAWLALRTGSLWPGACLHLAYNETLQLTRIAWATHGIRPAAVAIVAALVLATLHSAGIKARPSDAETGGSRS